ncbi:MAG: response regulator, partial [Coriobacteriia bacterium]|nr:response regulator [Coriobacteriia bacterium]
MKRDVAVILSVDDDPDIRDLISITLKSEGYEVVMAADGASGLAAATVSRPDLILLDYMMPGMNGVEVCARLQDSPVTSHIPVVFLTAVTGEVERSRAFALGAVDYLIKPLDPAVLKEAVSRHLATAGSFEQMSDRHEDTTLSSRIGPGAFPAFRDSLPDRFGLGRESAAFLGAMTPATMYVVAARLGISSADMAAAVSDALGIGLVTQIPAREVRLGVLPAPFSKSNLVVPVRNAVVGDAFVLSNPFNWDLLETLERTAGTGEDPNVLVAAPETVLAVFEAALEQVRRRIEI